MFLAIEYLILFEITKNKQEAAKTITILTLCVYAFVSPCLCNLSFVKQSPKLADE